MAADHFPNRFPAPAKPSDELGSRGAPPRDRAGLRQAVFDKKNLARRYPSGWLPPG
jgi:hypothetical protein